ncbi:MAG: rhodanese-like domain-containing protein [Rhodocyclaceae bacterium]|nr:rhodanese-like domain-containing protein [Rhodocyclaceae bacterium]
MRFLLALFCLLAAFAARAEVIEIDNAELARLTASGVPLVDIRRTPEWEETGIVSGSILLTFFDERGQSDPTGWLEKLKTIAPPGAPVILMCRSGSRTKGASQFLSQQAGYEKVYVVKHGIRDWIKEGRSLIPAAPAIKACQVAKTC